jgi:hypothetical protein
MAAVGRQRQFAARTSGHSIVSFVLRRRTSASEVDLSPEMEAANVGFEQQRTFDHES